MDNQQRHPNHLPWRLNTAIVFHPMHGRPCIVAARFRQMNDENLMRRRKWYKKQKEYSYGLTLADLEA